MNAMSLNRKISILIAISFLYAGLAMAQAPECEINACQCLTPIVIDVDGRGIKLTDAENGVFFDMAANGRPFKLAWTETGVRNAWLALDRNGNGKIDNGQELFGNFTPQPACKEPNGFLALAEYDKAENGGNGDGVIDNHDAIFPSLRLWIDANHNGTSESQELFSLPALGVQSISLQYKLSRKRDRYGNIFRYRSDLNVSLPSSDSIGQFAYDVFLTTQPTLRAQVHPDPQDTVQGAATPEQIPTEVAYGIFLRIASCSESDPELYQKKCRLVQRAVGLDGDDEQQLPMHLSGFHDEIGILDDQVAVLRNAKDPEMVAKRDALVAKRQSLIRDKVETLQQKLSREGKQRFDAYIETIKAKIKRVPSTSTQLSQP